MQKKLSMKVSCVLSVIILCLVLFCISAGAQERKVVVSSWGGDYEKAFKKTMAEPFEKKTGIKVIVTSYPDFAKMKAMVDSGNVEWDVVDTTLRELLQGTKAGIYEPLDYNVIDKRDIYPDVVHPYGIGIEYNYNIIAYSKKKFSSGNHPKSWADFWDVKKFPGRRGLINTSSAVYNMLIVALLADGVPKDKLYPPDVDRAFRSLDRIKPHVSVWWTKGAQPAQLLTDGELDMVLAFSGRIAMIKKEGVPVDIEFSEGLICPEVLVVLKGSKNKKEAMQLIDFCTQPKPQAEFNQMLNYGPVNRKAWNHIDIKSAPDIPTGPTVDKLVKFGEMAEWWVENGPAVVERWQAWMMK